MQSQCQDGSSHAASSSHDHQTSHRISTKKRRSRSRDVESTRQFLDKVNYTQESLLPFTVDSILCQGKLSMVYNASMAEKQYALKRIHKRCLAMFLHLTINTLVFLSTRRFRAGLEVFAERWVPIVSEHVVLLYVAAAMGVDGFDCFKTCCRVENRDPGHDCIVVQWSSSVSLHHGSPSHLLQKGAPEHKTCASRKHPSSSFHKPTASAWTARHAPRS